MVLPTEMGKTCLYIIEVSPVLVMNILAKPGFIKKAHTQICGQKPGFIKKSPIFENKLGQIFMG